MINWKRISVGQFDQLAEIKGDDPFKLRLQQIAILEDLDIDEVVKWNVDYVNSYNLSKEIPKTKLKFWFVHNRKFYRLPRTAKKIKASQFIDLQTSDGTITMNLAILAQRRNIFGKLIEEDLQERIEEFKTIPVIKIKSYTDFFLQLYPMLLEATRDYLRQMMTEIQTIQSEELPKTS